MPSLLLIFDVVAFCSFHRFNHFIRLSVNVKVYIFKLFRIREREQPEETLIADQVI